MSLHHEPVLLQEVLAALPQSAGSERTCLDVTAGGGGHFFSILNSGAEWRGECWDRDPDAPARIDARAQAARMCHERWRFRSRNFGAGLPADAIQHWNFILADIGVSSFQLDDAARGLSLHSPAPPDFRMDPRQGVPLIESVRAWSVDELARIFERYGEEPRAKRLAQAMKGWGPEAFASAKELAERIAQTLGYPRAESRIHPATRAFQALRIAVNDELGELRSLLQWAPAALKPGGRLAVISFHSLEDRYVKIAFQDLVKTGAFDILEKKGVTPTEGEVARNPRSRSARLRVLERAWKSDSKT